MRSSSGVTTGVSCAKSPIISNCIPPKGSPCSRNLRNTASIASSKSARTIDISSIISKSDEAIIFLFSLLKSNLLSTLAPGTYGENGNWKNEWMVTPPALMAATPVGATTIGLLRDCSTTAFRNVVFPVPALPVKNMLCPVFSTKSHAVCTILYASLFPLVFLKTDAKVHNFFCNMSLIG